MVLPFSIQKLWRGADPPPPPTHLVPPPRGQGSPKTPRPNRTKHANYITISTIDHCIGKLALIEKLLLSIKKFILPWFYKIYNMI